MERTNIFFFLVFLEGKKHERHLWVTNEGPVGDERSSRGHKSLCETFAEGFALVGELGHAGVSAAHLGGEKGALGCRESCPWSGVRDKSRGTLGASFSLWEVNGRGLIHCFRAGSVFWLLS